MIASNLTDEEYLSLNGILPRHRIEKLLYVHAESSQQLLQDAKELYPSDNILQEIIDDMRALAKKHEVSGDALHELADRAERLQKRVWDDACEGFDKIDKFKDVYE